MEQDQAKKACGYRAANHIENGMHVGIGTGSTVFYFIERLLERCEEGLKVSAAFSSKQSEVLALKGKITPLKSFTQLDITVDGADEIDPKGNMIKGGGGALFREKLLAASSKKMVVIVDESKCVEQLGHAKLPLEISSFASDATIEKIQMAGTLRMEGATPFISDGGNYIYDLHLDTPIQDPKALHTKLIQIPGVIETGLFFNLATHLIVGKSDNQVEEKTF